MNKIVGKITVEERNEIQMLFEHRNGLDEIAMIVSKEQGALYDKLVKDKEETNIRFQNWWEEKALKYQWESTKGGKWKIDFKTCDVYLIV